MRAIPGPSAVMAALAASGLPTSRFTFIGFLPSRGRARRSAVGEAAGARETVVLFESPTRAARLLAELAELAPARPACLLREMTKRYEEHRDGTVSELAAWARDRPLKGETHPCARRVRAGGPAIPERGRARRALPRPARRGTFRQGSLQAAREGARSSPPATSTIGSEDESLREGVRAVGSGGRALRLHGAPRHHARPRDRRHPALSL